MPEARRTPEPRSAPTEPRWLVLFHRIPPRPDYLRVKIGRRLREAGAVALRNSVYVLPATPAMRTLVASITRAIVAGGGQATVCEARFVEGLSDDGVESMFRAGRDAEYAKVAVDARRLATSLAGRRGRATPGSAAAALNRLRRRFDAIAARDPFGARGREETAGLLSLAEDRLQGVEAGAHSEPAPVAPRGATWVTRARVMVDRMGSAWLIRRFIDPAAHFKFVGARGYRPLRGEIRFDMAGAEFTHEGERCSFEVLLERFRPGDPALRCIAGMVHDLDLEDGRNGRPETSGLGRMVVGIALSTPDDATRLARSAIVFDGLYESFRKLGR